MRAWTICILFTVFCFGCNQSEEARKKEAEAKEAEAHLKWIELALQNYHSNPDDRPPLNIVADLSEIADGSNQFALDLYQQLQTKEGNLFFSPSSISTALAMTYAGAAGETEAEMANTLHIQMPNERLHEGMKTLQDFWRSPDPSKGIKLNLANRLWGKESFEFQPDFLRVTRDQYDAELAQLNFAQRENARQTINDWVEDQTENKITDLIPKGAITSDTRLVLTNAVYFYGTWRDPFKERLTKVEDFHLTATDTIKAPLMHRVDEFQYGDVDDIQILELPYGDGSLSMVVLLPKEVDGLADLEAKLSSPNLQRWMASVRDEDEVRVFLPKFKTTSQFEMSSTLETMGMKSAFDPDAADFSGMTGGRDLFISAVIHKAFVDVNEQGTEAAAATGIVMKLAAAMEEEPKQPPVFRADHPFVFMIRDNRTQAIMFLGRVSNPLE
ncbi:Serpin (serine protease inhibitor) [Novipirellula aureliae]|uniref:Serpin (Serine protease inhibitor) n=1 Tax=Novipirellula aureliae TaxID=2527966 RepID=A0A5C6E835_9BACT|nr:serpin family protein [Novipirellula aureliae]TWU44137.1 Serpin (serine protease inhibitor) [Novipirellula aureliae]